MIKRNKYQKKIKGILERITRKAEMVQELAGNYESIWENEGKPISDLELRMSSFPDREPSIQGGLKIDQCLAWYSPLQKYLGSNNQYEAFNQTFERTLTRKAFDNSMPQAVAELEKRFAQLPKNCTQWGREHSKEELEHAKSWLAEHLATPYSDQPLPTRIPYQSSEITSKKLQKHLEQMEKANPSLRYGRIAK